ncbi:MAG: DnaJ domain-containing protein [Marinobacterium sp.]
MPFLKTRRQQKQNSPKPSGNLSKEEAYDILGLKKGASKDEILAAHKRLMQKAHPDRGGSDWLAARINSAKETLLKD